MFRLFWSIVLLLLFTPLISAQDVACPEAVENTTAACDAFGTNAVCYGAGRVSAIQDCDDPEGFTTSGDVIALEGVCSMHVGARVSPEEWGLAVLHLAGDEATGEFVTLVLSGDIDVQNAASARSTETVHINANTIVRQGPGSQYDEVAKVNAGETVRVDACNCTRNWVRLLLDNGRSGWILARFIEEQDIVESLPTRLPGSPIYDTMQALRISTGNDEGACMRDGLLVQVPQELAPYPMEINGVPLLLSAGTLFVQAPANTDVQFQMLAGAAEVDLGDHTSWLYAGMTATAQVTDGDIVLDMGLVQPDAADGLPLALLPENVDVTAALNNPDPQVLSAPDCRVLADRGDTVCEVEFFNADGDAITQLTVDLVYAPEGEWTGSAHEVIDLIEGDWFSGTLGATQSCSVGSAGVVMGPIEWTITLEDAGGHVSEPFTFYSYCVAE